MLRVTADSVATADERPETVVWVRKEVRYGLLWVSLLRAGGRGRFRSQGFPFLPLLPSVLPPHLSERMSRAERRVSMETESEVG